MSKGPQQDEKLQPQKTSSQKRRERRRRANERKKVAELAEIPSEEPNFPGQEVHFDLDAPVAPTVLRAPEVAEEQPRAVPELGSGDMIFVSPSSEKTILQVLEEMEKEQQAALKKALEDQQTPKEPKTPIKELSDKEFQQLWERHTLEDFEALGEQKYNLLIANLREIEARHYAEIDKNFPQMSSIQWEKSGENARSIDIKSNGITTGTFKETTLQDGTRTIDFPKGLPGSKDSVDIMMTLRTPPEGDPPKVKELKDPQLYFTAHYDEEGKLIKVTSPQPIKFPSDPNLPGYIELPDGRKCTLPVNKNKYQEMLLEVNKNKGIERSQEQTRDKVLVETMRGSFPPAEFSPTTFQAPPPTHIPSNNQEKHTNRGR